MRGHQHPYVCVLWSAPRVRGPVRIPHTVDITHTRCHSRVFGMAPSQGPIGSDIARGGRWVAARWERILRRAYHTRGHACMLCRTHAITAGYGATRTRNAHAVIMFTFGWHRLVLFQRVVRGDCTARLIHRIITDCARFVGGTSRGCVVWV